MTKEQTYTLPASLVHSIAEYLTHRPYREVAQYLAALERIGPNAERSEGRLNES